MNQLLDVTRTCLVDCV